MPKFTDNASREWDLRLTAPVVMRIREECDPRFLLADGVDDSTYTRLQDDPALLCRVIFILCDRQRVERGVSEEDFYMRVIGDAIDGATSALLEAMLAFMPRNVSTLLETSAAKRDRMRQLGTERALAILNDPKLETELLAELDKAFDQILNRISA